MDTFSLSLNQLKVATNKSNLLVMQFLCSNENWHPQKFKTDTIVQIFLSNNLYENITCYILFGALQINGMLMEPMLILMEPMLMLTEPITVPYTHHIEATQWICRENQSTGFYMMVTSVVITG